MPFLLFLIGRSTKATNWQAPYCCALTASRISKGQGFHEAMRVATLKAAASRLRSSRAALARGHRRLLNKPGAPRTLNHGQVHSFSAALCHLCLWTRRDPCDEWKPPNVSSDYIHIHDMRRSSKYALHYIRLRLHCVTLHYLSLHHVPSHGCILL